MAVPSEPSSPVFVGRERELGIIRGLLQRSAAEEAQTLVVSGDAGVGKTALVSRACAEGISALTLFGACLPLTSMSIPLLPIRSALRSTDGSFEEAGIADLDRDDRDVTVRFDSWLTRRCRAEHVVLIVDDVQWADRSTLDALMYVIAGPARRRLTVVATLRSGEVGLGHPLQRWLADIRRLPRTSELVLEPLDRPGTAGQIRLLLGAVPHQSLIDDVHGRSRGNPYFTRLMVSGLASDARMAPASFPADLSSAVLQSWFRLSAETRRLATVLAVGGTGMRAGELSEVVGGTDPESIRSQLMEAVDSGTLDLRDDGSFWFHHPMNAEVLTAALGEDERREWHRRFADVLEARRQRPVPVATAAAIADHRFGAGETRAAFDWSLIAATAAGEASGRAEELRLLRRAVRLRAELPDAEESVDALLRRLRSAAADAGATGDELEAVETLLERVDADAEPLVASELRVRRMHLRFMRGLSFIEADEMQEAVRLASVDMTSPEYALALAELAHAELWMGDQDTAAEHARVAIGVARATDDPRALGMALAAGSMAASYTDDIAAARELGEEALAPALLARDWWGFVHAAMWEANAVETWASETYALRMRDRRLELSRHGGPHAYLAWLSAAEALAWLTSGAWREAEARLRVALGSDPGPLGDVEARLAAARLATLQGRQREAEGHLLRVEELVTDGSAFLALEYDAVRAEVRLASGDLVGAYEAALAGAVDRGARPTMSEWLIPLAARALADLAQATRDAGGFPDDELWAVDDLFGRFPHPIVDVDTTELARRQIHALDAMYGAERARAHAAPIEADLWSIAVDSCAVARLPWEEVYSSWRAAESLLGRGHDRQAGAAMLRHGLALARRLRARPVEDELRDLARRARVPIEEPQAVASDEPAALHGLTGREREVLDLVAVGRTYREIARALMISEKTVSTHVSHLLAKTGTANRVDLARLVHRTSREGDPND